MQSKYLWWVGAIIGLVVVLSLATYKTGRAPATPEESRREIVASLATPSSSSTSTLPVNTQSNAVNSGSVVNSQKKPVTKIGLVFLAPTLNAELVSGEQFTVSWNREPGYTGGLYLVDAQTQGVVGWLTANTTIHQTSFSWNARTVLLSRNNPAKKDISAGTYYLKLVFDGPQNPIQSPTFKIIYPQQVKDAYVSVEILGAKFSPGPFSVPKGTKLQINNRDGVAYQLKIGNATLPLLGPGGSTLFDTESLSMGSYEVKADAFPSLTTTLTVR